MKFFAFVSLFSLFLLSWTRPFAVRLPPAKKDIPELIKGRHRALKASFKYAQNANITWAVITGEKKGITPRVQKSFDVLELGFLFSPSGIHLGALMGMLFYFINKIKSKKIPKLLKWFFLLAVYFLPYLTIKRLVIFRALFYFQRILKKRIPIEILFSLTFFISFLLGHFSSSPLSFILSFLYMGTFIALRDFSKLTIILGLFSSHLIIALFSGSEVSLLSLILNIPLISLFSLVMPLVYFYFASFQWIDFNWIEWIIRSFIVLVGWAAKLVQGTLLSSTVFLILAVWVVLLKKQKRYLVVFLFLHGNVANSPALFSKLA